MTNKSKLTEAEFEAALNEVDPFTSAEALEDLAGRAPTEELAESLREFLRNTQSRRGMFETSPLELPALPAIAVPTGIPLLHSHPT